MFVVRATGPGRRAWTLPAHQRGPGEAAGLLTRELLRALGDRLLPHPRALMSELDRSFAELAVQRRWTPLDAQQPGYRLDWPPEPDLATGPLLLRPTPAEQALARELAPLLERAALTPAALTEELRAGGLPLARLAAPDLGQLVAAVGQQPHGAPTLVETVLRLLGDDRPADPEPLWDAAELARADDLLTVAEHRGLSAALAGLADGRLRALLALGHLWRDAAGRGTDTLQGVLAELEAAGRTGRVPVLLEFVAAVAECLAGQEWQIAAELRQWCHLVLDRLGLDVAPQLWAGARAVADRAAERQLTVLIELTVHQLMGMPWQFGWQAWLADLSGGYRRLPGAAAGTDWDGLAQGIGELLRSQCAVAGEEPAQVEFLLPVEHLDLPVELIALPPHGRPLGGQLPVVVRVRRHPDTHGQWQRRWAGATAPTGGAATEPRAQWISHPAQAGPDALGAALDGHPEAACVALPPAAEGGQLPAVAACVSRGLPVIAFQRGPDPLGPRPIETVPPAGLPHEIRRQRSAPADPAASLVLVWDDPRRMPPALPKLRSPVRKK
jgi:hypothetical protein